MAAAALRLTPEGASSGLLLPRMKLTTKAANKKDAGAMSLQEIPNHHLTT
jgi:hypothetical protein